MNGTISRIRLKWMNIHDRLASTSSPGYTPWLLVKTIIRGATALLALISLVCFATAIPLWNQNLVHTRGPNKGDWQDGIPIAPLALAFLYNMSTAIYAIKTANRVPYIIEAVVDFLVWAALVPALVFATWGGVFNVWQRAVGDSSGIVMCNLGLNIFSKECWPELYSIGMAELAGIAFAVPVGMLHIFLFIHGVFERCTRSRRVEQRAADMVKGLEESSNSIKWERYPQMPRQHVYS